jgi:hypothetical protein
VNWGDGSARARSTPNRARFHLRHRYETPGTYKVRATWRDSLGQSNSRDLTLVVGPHRAQLPAGPWRHHRG